MDNLLTDTWNLRRLTRIHKVHDMLIYIPSYNFAEQSLQGEHLKHSASNGKFDTYRQREKDYCHYSPNTIIITCTTYGYWRPHGLGVSCCYRGSASGTPSSFRSFKPRLLLPLLLGFKANYLYLYTL